MVKYKGIIMTEVLRLKKRKIALLLSAIVFVTVAVLSFGTAFAFDTDKDPLITLSYLNEVAFPEFKKDILRTIGLLPPEVELEIVPEPEPVQQPEFAGSSTAVYTLLELSRGQTVTADSICEFIVRPGSIVTAVSPFPAQGIADITNGIEVLNDEEISINAYCLIPRGSDGRGISVQSDKAYIMIRGEYSIG